MLIFVERDLRTVLARYPATTNGRRPYRSRRLCPLAPYYPAVGLSHEQIKHRTVLGGIINEYERAA